MGWTHVKPVTVIIFEDEGLRQESRCQQCYAMGNSSCWFEKSEANVSNLLFLIGLIILEGYVM